MTGDAAAGSVLVVGSIHVDVVLQVPTLPVEGQTVLADARTQGHGGKGANQAVAAAARARTPGQTSVAMVGAVGDEPAGREALDELARCGVDTSGVAVVPGSTARAFVVVDAAGSNLIVVDPAVAVRVDPAVVAGHVRERRPAVVLVQRELPAPAVAAALEAAREVGATTVLNAAPAEAAGGSGVPWGAVDVLVVNAAEAAALLEEREPTTGEESLALARRLLGLGVGRVVVTLGAGGVVAVEGEDVRPLVVAAHPTTVVDTTGAGDAFCGGLVAALATGTAFEAAVREGLEAGAAAVATPGARLAHAAASSD
ncbi:PfkB family carbohydrate kinase [Pseudokineococcus sp. 1T1Z-3]|uniref:PfkB family carbohydrate kinase n=1 Tax=Pseudokineococcus sp. 1T1Z-3 TaxID=3132745 RepID=UPI00309CC578